MPIPSLSPVLPDILTLVQYTFTITEVNNWVGGDGVAKAKAMLINGKLTLCLAETGGSDENQITDYHTFRTIPR